MSEVVIQVEKLGKRYRIGGPRGAYGTLRDTIASAVQVPFQILRGQRARTKEFWALNDISFELRQGEVLGIIGRNGAGKSTLLKILSRVTYPTTGRAEVWGRVGSLLEVGTGFHPELTGRENIYLNGAVLGMKRMEIQRKFDEIIDFAEIEQFLDTPVKRYSSGMYMRLAFAIAAHLEPEILIVDEVLAVGDASFQKKCLGKMSNVAHEGRTVLFVSHNMAAIRTLCSSAIVLDSGNITCRGNAKECIDFYSAQYTQIRGSTWRRPPRKDESGLIITQVNSVLNGPHTDPILELEIFLESRSRHKAAFLAIDVLDTTGTTLMQALPKLEGFIEDGSPTHYARVEIELPSLIPGQYLATIWAGSHNTETLDEIREVVAFEVFESPTQGRTYPHTVDHGYIVPRSTIREYR